MKTIDPGRDQIESAIRQVAADNPWYTSDQFESQVHGAYRHNMSLRYKYVLAHLGSLDGKTVVDIGCGDGQWSKVLKDRFAIKLIGVDYNDVRLERYRRNVPSAEGLLGTCLEVPVENRSADLVMCHQVLEHLGDPSAALQEMRRIVKADGMLLLSVPNEGTWLKQKVQYRWIEPRALDRSDHVQFFTKGSFRRLIEDAGFAVDRLDSVGFYFPHNGLSRRMLSRRWLFGVSILFARTVPVFRDCLFAWARPKSPV